MQTTRTNRNIEQPSPAELDWLAQLRQQALERGADLPRPTGQEERWRYTDLGLLRLSDFRPAPALSVAGVEPPEGWDRPGLGAVAVDGGSAPARVDPALARAGLVVADLELAAAEHAGLAAAHLGRLVGADGHFTAHALAHGRGGRLVRVPAGLTLEQPLRLVQSYTRDSAGRAHFPRTVVVVEQGARVTLEQVFVGAGPAADAAPTLVAPVVELFVGPGARVGWVSWQELAAGQRFLGHLAARLERDAELKTALVSLGGELSRVSQQVTLAGEGAHSEMLGAYFPLGEEQVEHWTVQDHRAPNTTSDLLHVGALADAARSVYYGTIRIAHGARRSDAYQANRNLVLSPRAKADTNPQLEIATNDVRCTHGATVGPLDPEVMFYLQSRGLPPAAARRLAVQGFFGKLLGRMSWTGLADRLADTVQRRTGAPS